MGLTERYITKLLDMYRRKSRNELIKQIKRGNMTAVIFYLKTKGKSRGYIERHEIDTEPKHRKIMKDEDPIHYLNDYISRISQLQ